MKRLVLLLIVILPLFLTNTTIAQDKYSPWTASLSTNAVNNPVRMLPGEKGKFKTWNMDPDRDPVPHLNSHCTIPTLLQKQCIQSTV